MQLHQQHTFHTSFLVITKFHKVIARGFEFPADIFNAIIVNKIDNSVQGR